MTPIPHSPAAARADAGDDELDRLIDEWLRIEFAEPENLGQRLCVLLRRQADAETDEADADLVPIGEFLARWEPRK